MNTKTKILLIGDASLEIYVKAFYKAFLMLGFENVQLFCTDQYCGDHVYRDSLVRRIENKIAIGPHVLKLNIDLRKCVREFNPDFVFIYTSRLIEKKTILTIKKLKKCILFSYCNDNPFASYYPKYFWRNYKKAVQYSDAGFVYRKENLEDYRRIGCNKAYLLRSYYLDNRNYYIPKSNMGVPPVVFLGHYENDERPIYIKALLENQIEVGITKNTWEFYEPQNPFLFKFENSFSDYNEIINATKIAIVFLSKINNDTYTRRCFEIPATKTMMIASYTDDLASLYEEDKEVVFYRNKEEFVEKIKYYLVHDSEREKIAQAGYQRLMKDGHEVKNRIRQIIDVYDKVAEEKMDTLTKSIKNGH